MEKYLVDLYMAGYAYGKMKFPKWIFLKLKALS